MFNRQCYRLLSRWGIAAPGTGATSIYSACLNICSAKEPANFYDLLSGVLIWRNHVQCPHTQPNKETRVGAIGNAPERRVSSHLVRP